MSKKSHPGVSKFANVIDKRMSGHIEASSFPTLDFATVQEDYSLQLNQFNQPIPKGDYFILNTLNVGDSESEFAETTSASHTHSGGEHSGHEGGNGSHNHSGGEHKHKVKLPDRFAKLLPGDRVLVCWVLNTVVVIGKFESAEEL